MSTTDTRPDASPIASSTHETYVRPGRLWNQHSALDYVGRGWRVRSWRTRTDDGSVVQGAAEMPVSRPNRSRARQEAARRLDLTVRELPAYRVCDQTRSTQTVAWHQVETAEVGTVLASIDDERQVVVAEDTLGRYAAIVRSHARHRPFEVASISRRAGQFLLGTRDRLLDGRQIPRTLSVLPTIDEAVQAYSGLVR